MTRTAMDRSRVYIHEDVHNLANQVSNYLPNMGGHWPFSEDIRHEIGRASCRERV